MSCLCIFQYLVHSKYQSHTFLPVLFHNIGPTASYQARAQYNLLSAQHYLGEPLWFEDIPIISPYVHSNFSSVSDYLSELDLSTNICQRLFQTLVFSQMCVVLKFLFYAMSRHSTLFRFSCYFSYVCHLRVMLCHGVSLGPRLGGSLGS